MPYMIRIVCGATSLFIVDDERDGLYTSDISKAAVFTEPRLFVFGKFLRDNIAEISFIEGPEAFESNKPTAPDLGLSAIEFVDKV